MNHINQTLRKATAGVYTHSAINRTGDNLL